MPYSEDPSGKIVYSGSVGERTIRSIRAASFPRATWARIFSAARQSGSQAYVSSAPSTNAGTAEFSAASVTPGSQPGQNFSVKFEADPVSGRWATA